MTENKKNGRPRKYVYSGKKITTSIRLSSDELELIHDHFENKQEFIQWSLKQLEKKKSKK